MNGAVTTHRTRTLREMLFRLQGEGRQSTAMEKGELRGVDEALTRLDAGKIWPMSEMWRRNLDRAPDGDSIRFVLR